MICTLANETEIIIHTIMLLCRLFCAGRFSFEDGGHKVSVPKLHSIDTVSGLRSMQYVQGNDIKDLTLN